MKTEKDYWDATKELLGHYRIGLHPHWKFDFKRDPKTLGFLMSRCKFASKMACQQRTVIEFGCDQGFGAAILGEMATSYFGIDSDPQSIETAKKNHPFPKFTFRHEEWLGKHFGLFDSAISYDTFLTMRPDQEDLWMETLSRHISSAGICVVGMSSLLDRNKNDRLSGLIRNAFHHALPFSMSDEIVHSGLAGDYQIYLCCHKK